MQQAKIFIPFFQLQIQIIPNFFDRYQQFSMGSEISGFRRNFGKIGREKNPCPALPPPPEAATLLSSPLSPIVVARRLQRLSLPCMSVDGRELVPHDWEADAEQGGNVPMLFPGVAPPG
jgi:hypothetical protein